MCPCCLVECLCHRAPDGCILCFRFCYLEHLLCERSQQVGIPRSAFGAGVLFLGGWSASHAQDTDAAAPYGKIKDTPKCTANARTLPLDQPLEPIRNPAICGTVALQCGTVPAKRRAISLRAACHATRTARHLCAR